MEIVPGNQTLERESWLENQYIGLIETARPAEIKLHIFHFTQYGVIDGVIEEVSADTIVGEQQGMRLIYKTTVCMHKIWLNVEGYK
jgi:hypothetical protein